METKTGGGRLLIERVQTGVRMEKRLVKVLKAWPSSTTFLWEISWRALSSTLSKANLLSARSPCGASTILKRSMDWIWTPERATA